MREPVVIEYGTGARIALVPGRAVRLAGEDYPLFRPPDPAKVGRPDDCLTFLREFHLSHCGVFDVALRRWMGRYFDAVTAVIEGERARLIAPAGLDPDVAHLAWAYTAYRPFPNAAFEWAGSERRVPVLFWLEDGPLAVRFADGGDDGDGDGALRTLTLDRAALNGETGVFADRMAPVLEGFWRGVAAPRHPFVRSALSGLRG
jgi:hypothetical protein